MCTVTTCGNIKLKLDFAKGNDTSYFAANVMSAVIPGEIVSLRYFVGEKKSTQTLLRFCVLVSVLCIGITYRICRAK